MAEIEDRLNKLRSPFRSAETFWIEEIIDPRDTRKILCEFVELAAPVRGSGPSEHVDAALDHSFLMTLMRPSASM